MPQAPQPQSFHVRVSRTLAHGLEAALGRRDDKGFASPVNRQALPLPEEDNKTKSISNGHELDGSRSWASMNVPSNIRVTINFTQSTVFAGEDVECIITFTNVARPVANGRRRGGSTSKGHSITPSPIAASRPLPTQLKRGHRPTKSLAASSKPQQPDAPASTSTGDNGRAKSASAVEKKVSKNRRSLSIISISSNTVGQTGNSSNGGGDGDGSVRRHTPTHTRSTSLQSPARRFTPATSSPLDRRISPGVAQQSFEFPSSLPSPLDLETTPPLEDASSMSGVVEHKPTESYLNPITRIMADTHLNGTPRSSLDMDSMSNHSDETLASEYPQPQALRGPLSRFDFTSGRQADAPVASGPETLMMGYAHVLGSFTLDGSLVNQAPFEEVKRRGVVAGGVVGLDNGGSKRDGTGFFGALGWSNIGQSIGGLLGGPELSSIKEMRSMANSKSIPIISTPQSVLFVDLRLSPGESRRYSYSFTLPKALPPSHKGRAIKISYNLAVGILSGSERRVRCVKVPFRVLGGVNSRGDILAHDLLAPHVFLRDVARTSSLPAPKPVQKSASESDISDFLDYVDALVTKLPPPHSAMNNLSSPTSASILTPTSPHARRHSSVGEPSTIKESIDLAILRSNQRFSSSSLAKLSNRFDIARSGRRVATLLLPRPAYRLGETVTLVFDFARAAVACHAVHVALESCERVDSAIAMRSPASVYRCTRKLHAQAAGSALFAKRLSFALGLPAGATPEFVTSGVGLEWRLRIEFVTPLVSTVRATAAAAADVDAEAEADGEAGKEEEEKLMKKKKKRKDDEDRDENDHDDDDDDVDDDDRADDPDAAWDQLLEEVGRDDRGLVLQGAEKMAVETFEVALPLRVYGAIMGGKSDCDVEDLVV